jgi:hypothetical protein
MGGSVPLYMIVGAWRISNENLRIQNLWDGIELMAALLAM